MMRKRMRKYLLIVLALIITGCTAQKEKSYTQISMDEAVKMMETNDGHSRKRLVIGTEWKVIDY